MAFIRLFGKGIKGIIYTSDIWMFIWARIKAFSVGEFWGAEVGGLKVRLGMEDLFGGTRGRWRKRKRRRRRRRKSRRNLFSVSNPAMWIEI